MIIKALHCCAAAAALATFAYAQEGPVPTGIPHLDHVFVIMMENHGYSQLVNNPNAPFINEYAKRPMSARTTSPSPTPASPTIWKSSVDRTSAS